MTKNGNTLIYRVGQVERKVERLEDKLDLVMENHLPHLRQSVERNSTLIKTATVLNIGAIILAAVLLKYL